VLFIEKEGFTPVLEAARLPERFDIALMSTKGMSVTAARMLVDELCGRLGLKLFVLHDFDITGFSIWKTLIETGRRYRFKHDVGANDLGLRLVDVELLGLASESVIVDKDRIALTRRLRINGATDDEIAFLLSGRRVELNAMTSDVFVRFVEDGLRAHGVTKVVPSTATLAEAYAAYRRGVKAKRALDAELEG
jgi:DNA topoisomerase VI subunit A